jgi:hypothetical protein
MLEMAAGHRTAVELKVSRRAIRAARPVRTQKEPAMKKKLILDKERLTSTEQIVVDLDGAGAPRSDVRVATDWHSCWDTDCTCTLPTE